MKPITFEQSNIVIAKDQPEYLPLPACITRQGEVITCWQLSFLERLQILFTGRIWLRILTFGKALQPILPETKDPFVKS